MGPSTIRNEMKCLLNNLSCAALCVSLCLFISAFSVYTHVFWSWLFMWLVVGWLLLNLEEVFQVSAAALMQQQHPQSVLVKLLEKCHYISFIEKLIASRC